jgi:GNAT superfamily N-acetyltransferase
MDNIFLRETTEAEDGVIARHFFQLWQDNAVPETGIQENWLEITLEFILHARQTLDYKAFVAECNGAIVGSVGCQSFAGLYPAALARHTRYYGYIWGVYVEPAYRHQGVGTRLTEQAIAHLKSLNCTRAILHASPVGKPIYTKMGFQPSNEMFLDLNPLV